jgi:hypothetical protein
MTDAQLIVYDRKRWDKRLAELDYQLEAACESGDHDGLRMATVERLALVSAINTIFKDSDELPSPNPRQSALPSSESGQPPRRYRAPANEAEKGAR